MNIPGLKLIRLTGQCDLADDPTLPFKLVAEFRPPEFMNVTFIMMHGGTEECHVRGETRDAIDEFVKLNELRTHPRLRRLTITGPAGQMEQVNRG